MTFLLAGVNLANLLIRWRVGNELSPDTQLLLICNRAGLSAAKTIILDLVMSDEEAVECLRN